MRPPWLGGLIVSDASFGTALAGRGAILRSQGEPSAEVCRSADQRANGSLGIILLYWWLSWKSGLIPPFWYGRAGKRRFGA